MNLENLTEQNKMATLTPSESDEFIQLKNNSSEVPLQGDNQKRYFELLNKFKQL
jgi:hypothetical protein